MVRALRVQIEDICIRLVLGQERPSVPFFHEMLQFAVPLIPIAENAGVGGTGDDASGLQPLIHAVSAESAFDVGAFIKFDELDGFHGADPVAAVSMLEEPVLDEMTIHVGARDVAGAASDAELVVHHHNPVRADVRRSSRARGGAGRIGTVIAKRGEEYTFRSRIAADFVRHNPREVNPFRSRVFLLTGQSARIAADAALEINHHAQSSHRSTSQSEINQPLAGRRMIALVATCSPSSKFLSN